MRTRISSTLLFFLGLVTLGCDGKKKIPAPQGVEVVRDVRIVEVQRKAVPDYIEAVGTIRAVQASQLSAQIVASIVAMQAHEGQQVRKGQTLVVLDDAQHRATLERAAAAVSAAQQDISAADAEYGLTNATLARYQTLYEKKSVSPHEMDEIQARAKMASARRDQAQAGLAQARAMEAQARAGLGFTRIRAPFDGVITAKHADAGALAAPGGPLLTIEDTRRFRLEASVDESEIGLVRRGAKASVQVEAVGTELAGTVVEIVPAADAASRSFIVKIELPADPRIRSGLFGRVRFPRGERQAVILPVTAVAERGQLQGVYVVASSDMAGLRFVTLGKRSGDQVEVLSGLEGGERVVAQPGDRDLSGKRVEGHL